MAPRKKRTRIDESGIDGDVEKEDVVLEQQKLIERLQGKLATLQEEVSEVRELKRDKQRAEREVVELRSEVERLRRQSISTPLKTPMSVRGKGKGKARVSELSAPTEPVRRVLEMLSSVRVDHFDGSEEEGRYLCTCTNEWGKRSLKFELVLLGDDNVEYRPGDWSHAGSDLPDYLCEPIYFDVSQAPMFLVKVVTALYSNKN